MKLIINTVGFVLWVLSEFFKKHKALCTTLGIAAIYYEVQLIRTNAFNPTFNEFIVFFLLYEFTSVKEIILKHFNSVSGFYLYVMAQVDKNWGYMSPQELHDITQNRLDKGTEG